MKNISAETKQQVRVLFLVIAVFLTVIIVVMYAAINDNLNITDTPASSPVSSPVVLGSITHNDDIQSLTYAHVGTKLQYSGTILKPSPCSTVTDNSLTLQTYPEQVQLRFNFAESAQANCAQVLTPETISGEVEVGVATPIVTVFDNGQQIQ